MQTFNIDNLLYFKIVNNRQQVTSYLEKKKINTVYVLKRNYELHVNIIIEKYSFIICFYLSSISRSVVMNN